MPWEPATIEDSQEIASIYYAAFPGSIRRFFPKKEQTQLLALLEQSFKLFFLLGVQGVVIKDSQGKICGYCLWSLTKSQSAAEGKVIFSTALKLIPRLTIKEIMRLLQNKFLMGVSTRREIKIYKAQAEIISLAIHPNFQGQGLGTKLLYAALDHLEKETVALNVHAGNYAAQRLYQGAGFKRIGNLRDLSGEWFMLIRPPKDD